jgi:hypothetical protein
MSRQHNSSYCDVLFHDTRRDHNLTFTQAAEPLDPGTRAFRTFNLSTQSRLLSRVFTWPYKKQTVNSCPGYMYVAESTSPDLTSLPTDLAFSTLR